MQKSSAGGNNFDDEREQGGRDVVIGDADNVQKTSYVVGRGTDPDAADPDRRAGGEGAPGAGGAPRRGDARGYTATVDSGGGLNLGVWIVALLALVIALVYGFGLFT